MYVGGVCECVMKCLRNEEMRSRSVMCGNVSAGACVLVVGVKAAAEGSEQRGWRETKRGRTWEIEGEGKELEREGGESVLAGYGECWWLCVCFG